MEQLIERCPEANGADGPVSIALWGCATVYREHINQLLAMQEMGQIRLVAVADSSLLPVARLDGMPVIAPSELADTEFEYLMITAKNDTDALADFAVTEYGIPRSKVLTYHLLHVPGLDFRMYRRLRDSRLSIVSNDSWGCLACRTLQMEHLSPFKHVRFRLDDYLKVLAALKAYMAIDDIRFKGMQEVLGPKPLLVFDWGDVELRIEQDATDGASSDPEAVLSRWYSERDTINWDNLVVQMATTDPGFETRFNELDCPGRKLCFVPYETHQPFSLRLPVFPDYVMFSQSVDESAQAGGKALAFNLVQLLLGENGGLRYEFS